MKEESIALFPGKVVLFSLSERAKVKIVLVSL